MRATISGCSHVWAEWMQSCRAGGQLVEPLPRIVLSSSTNLECGVHICDPAFTRAEVWALELETILSFTKSLKLVCAT